MIRGLLPTAALDLVVSISAVQQFGASALWGLQSHRSGAAEQITGNYHWHWKNLQNGFGQVSWLTTTIQDSKLDSSSDGTCTGIWRASSRMDLRSFALHDFNGNGVVSSDELEGIVVWIDSNSNVALDEN
jgi:hypothetical protein